MSATTATAPDVRRATAAPSLGSLARAVRAAATPSLTARLAEAQPDDEEHERVEERVVVVDRQGRDVGQAGDRDAQDDAAPGHRRREPAGEVALRAAGDAGPPDGERGARRPRPGRRPRGCR